MINHANTVYNSRPRVLSPNLGVNEADILGKNNAEREVMYVIVKVVEQKDDNMAKRHGLQLLR